MHVTTIDARCAGVTEMSDSVAREEGGTECPLAEGQVDVEVTKRSLEVTDSNEKPTYATQYFASLAGPKLRIHARLSTLSLSCLT